MKRLLLILLLAAPAYARTLSWDQISVRAHLDEAGRLRVREEQVFRFDGDWNGGERIFDVRRGQTFQFERISRLDPVTTTVTPLRAGSLSAVDEYQFVNDKTIRWRSRLPEDPPFQNQQITYILEYTLGNILIKSGDRYTLEHDFALPDRLGEIRRFIVDLSVAPSWKAVDLQQRYEAGPLPPGRSFLVTGTVEYTGTAAPEAQRSTLLRRLILAAMLLITSIALWLRMVQRERELGRLAPLETSAITPQWIDQNLLPIAAEVVGAAWDEDVGKHEVSALLARWTGEDKVKTTIDTGGELSMDLLVPREEFQGYERELIDKLFFEGTTTSTSLIKAHYKSRGFNPGSIIGRHVLAKANELSAMTEPGPPINKFYSLGLFVVTALLLAMGLNDDAAFAAIAGLWVLGVLWMIALFTAMRWRGRIDYGLGHARVFVVCLSLAVLAVLAILLINPFSMTAQVGYVTAALLVVNNVLNVAKSKRGPKSIAYRKRLAAVRQYFADELGKSTPAIDDRWFPYVIAFGLDDQASAWAQSFGGVTYGSTTFPTSSSSRSSSSSSTPQWTGGGGAFGGAGATGAWTAAAAGVAAGVASPSSRGGGGGGRGSSGGGGGGGW